MRFEFKFEEWISPIVFISGGILLGYIVDWLVLNKLKRWAERSTWRGDDVILRSLYRMPLLWFFLAGLYGAVVTSSLAEKQIHTLEKILLILTILSITVVMAQIAGGFVKIYSTKQEGILPSATIFINLARIFVFALGLLMIFHVLGINITPMLTALGIGGLAVALALQDSLANFFSGLQVLASRQIMPGDYVKLEAGEEGYVEDITWRNTTIRTLPNNLVIVPNSKIASNIITNYHRPNKELAVLVQVGVSYSSNLEKVERVTTEVAKAIQKNVQGGISEFEPFIRYHTFGESSVNFTVILRGQEYVDQHVIKHEFMKKLHERYHQEGIEIPFPIRTVYLKQ